MPDLKKELKNRILSSPIENYEAIGEISPPPIEKVFDVDIDSDGLRFQSDRLDQLKADRYRSDTNDRKWLAGWATTVVSIWLAFVLLILIIYRKLGLSDSVVMTLLGTTTLNVLGLSFIVLRGHFNGEKDSL